MGIVLFGPGLEAQFFYAALQCVAGASVFEVLPTDMRDLDGVLEITLSANRWKREFVFNEPLFRLRHNPDIPSEVLLMLLSCKPKQVAQQAVATVDAYRYDDPSTPRQQVAPPDVPLDAGKVLGDEESTGFVILDALPLWICGEENPAESHDFALMAKKHQEWVKRVLGLADLSPSHPFAEIIMPILGGIGYFNEAITPSIQQSMFHLVYPLVLHFVWQMNRFRAVGQIGDNRREGNAVTAQMVETVRVAKKIAKTLEEMAVHPLLLQSIDHKLLDLVIQAGFSPYTPKLRPEVVFLALLQKKVPGRVGKMEWIGAYRKTEAASRSSDDQVDPEPIDYPDVLVPMDGMEDGASRIGERVAMLAKGPIYIKPSEGSMGRGIVEVSWNGSSVCWKISAGIVYASINYYQGNSKLLSYVIALPGPESAFQSGFPVIGICVGET